MESNDNNRLEDLLRKMYAEERLQTGDQRSEMDIDTSEMIDEEWQKFEAKHFGSEKPHSSLFTIHYSLKKLAAMFVGLLMLSGIAYAAVQMVRHTHTQEQAWNQGDRSLDSDGKAMDQGPVPLIPDSTAQPRLYDNVPLGEILDELSTYYNITVVYRTEEARHPRLYYQWKPEYTIEKVVEMLNNFEWLQMELKQDTLYVKSTAIPAHDC